MRILMCPPDFFSIAYEINPWMHITNNANQNLARQQWEDLYNSYLARGVKVEVIAPQNNLPDMVFTANAGLVLGKQVIISCFRFQERQGEEPFFRSWFVKQNFEVKELPAGIIFEGEGEALPYRGERIFHGVGFRSDNRAPVALARAAGLEVVPLTLCDPRFYHLDTCFNPLTDDIVVYYPGAFTEESVKVIQEYFPRAIAVSEEAAKSFVCNMVLVGDEIFMSDGVFSEVDEELGACGFNVVHFNMSEFRKSGGGVHCLTLMLEY